MKNANDEALGKKRNVLIHFFVLSEDDHLKFTLTTICDYIVVNRFLQEDTAMQEQVWERTHTPAIVDVTEQILHAGLTLSMYHAIQDTRDNFPLAVVDIRPRRSHSLCI